MSLRLIITSIAIAEQGTVCKGQSWRAILGHFINLAQWSLGWGLDKGFSGFGFRLWG